MTKAPTDYSPFGVTLSGRNFTLTGAEKVRHGYQGSEKDDEMKGEGNSYTTEFRQLDPRLGRWFSIDPVFQPWQSPYCSMNNSPILLNDPRGDDPPKGFKKWKGANGTDLFVPSSAKNLGVFTDDDKNGRINYGSKNLKAKVGEIRRFSIEGISYRARFKDDGSFNGYWDAKGNQYKNPDVEISSGDFSGQNLSVMNVTFDVQNVPADGLQIVQTDSYSKIDTRYASAMAAEGMPLNSSGLIPNQYYFVDNGTKYAGEVDGAKGSFFAYQNGGIPANPNGPYYLTPNELSSDLLWNGISGSVNVYDQVTAKKMQKDIKFTTMLVAVNYLSTGKDVVLATYNWGFTNYGKKPLHTSKPSLVAKPSSGVSSIIHFYYPNYSLIK